MTTLRNEAKGIIKDVPGYSNLVNDYSNTTGLIKDIQKGLSLGNKAQSDTAFRKLSSVLRTNNEFRQQVVKELDKETGGTLLPKIAGQQLSEILPRGLARSVEAVGGVGALASGVGILPIIKAAIVTSPRAVGELISALGFGAEKGKAIVNQILKTTGKIEFPGDAILKKTQATDESSAQAIKANIPNNESKISIKDTVPSKNKGGKGSLPNNKGKAKVGAIIAGGAGAGIVAISKKKPVDIQNLPGKEISEKSYSMEVNSQKLKIKESDLQKLEAIVYGEVSNNKEKDKEIRDIISTVLNRMTGKYETMGQVLDKPNQYQAKGGNQYKNYVSGKIDELSKPKAKIVKQIVDEIRNGTFKTTNSDVRYTHKKGKLLLNKKGY